MAMPPLPDERGDTLIEVIISLIIIGVVGGAFFAAIATSSTASKSHRDLVSADAVLRDYAEATKSAVRDATNGCGKSNPTTFTVVFPPPEYTMPPGFTVSSTPSLVNQACPSVTSVQSEHLTVTWGGHSKSLDIVVRTP
jgi:prepilin-type N-terminal cleavage/methylation domain-containing protein